MRVALLILSTVLMSVVAHGEQSIDCKVYQQAIGTDANGALVEVKVDIIDFKLAGIKTAAGTFYRGEAKAFDENHLQLSLAMVGEQTEALVSWLENANVVTATSIFSRGRTDSYINATLYNPVIATKVAQLNRSFPGVFNSNLLSALSGKELGINAKPVLSVVEVYCK